MAGKQPPDLLASLGVALSRLNEQVAEASQVYEACLARFREEKEQHGGQADYECDWKQPSYREEAPGAAVLVEGAADASPPPAAAFEARVEDGPPPATLPAPTRTAFFVAPALPKPTGDACPRTPQKLTSWTKMVRPEAEHGAADGSLSVVQVATEPESELPSARDLEVDSARRPGGTALAEKMIAQRLLSRLGKRSTTALVTGGDLHQAVSAMGLERYSLKEMEHLISTISVLINLEFLQPNSPPSPRPLSSPHHPGRLANRPASPSDRAQWTWPSEVCKESSWHKASHHNVHACDAGLPADQQSACIPIKALIKAMTAADGLVKKLFTAKHCEQLFAIREVLVSGDANRLVSELTCVRIDDLATRTPEQDIPKMELLLGAMLIANGLMVGVQTDEQLGEWAGWFWLEVGFTSYFLVEILVRQWQHGLRAFLCGTNYGWNLFDAFLVALGIQECVLLGLGVSKLSYVAMVRFIRLLKLMRLVRIFRLRFMGELQLMIKGLLGGARTLCWAFVLLIFVMYILGVLTYSAFSNDEDEFLHEVFPNIPTAMFTCFCCITGDCVTRHGNSILHTLVDLHGLQFAVCFFTAYVAIALGVFNVILAIYVETTMTAAKQTEDANKGSKERASIRVAHVTKRLLKLFCAAERSFNCPPGERRPSLNIKNLLASADLESTEVQESTAICKELFLLVIQEPEVKKLMDELDIPPDRANLFESIDADGSGSLEASELVRGLLKVRGEVKKSDQVACILAVRAVQGTLREMAANMQEHQRMLEELRGGACVGPAIGGPSPRAGAW